MHVLAARCCSAHPAERSPSQLLSAGNATHMRLAQLSTGLCTPLQRALSAAQHLNGVNTAAINQPCNMANRLHARTQVTGREQRAPWEDCGRAVQDPGQGCQGGLGRARHMAENCGHRAADEQQPACRGVPRLVTATSHTQPLLKVFQSSRGTAELDWAHLKLIRLYCPPMIAGLTSCPCPRR